MEVEAEVVGQPWATKDVAQQALEPRPEQDRVVGELRIPLVRAEVEDEQ
jgi:hypothetical protein